MTPAHLAAIGKALRGPYWQSPLARELGISPRHLRYFLDGTRPIPDHHIKRLVSMLYEQRETIDKLARETPLPS